MKKQLLSIILALTMLVGLIPATTLTASAAEIKDADISKFEQYFDYMQDTWGYYYSMNLAMITDVEIHSTGWLPNAFTAPSRYYNTGNSYSLTVNPQTGEKTYSYDYSPVISYGAVTSSRSKELSYETFPGSTWIFAYETNKYDYAAAYLDQVIAVFNVSTHQIMEDPNNLPAGAYITGYKFIFGGGSSYREEHLTGFPTATDYGVDLNEYINITVDGKKATRQEGSVDGLSSPKNLNPIPYTYQVTDTLSAGMPIVSYCDALSDVMVWGPVVYVYDEKPEIHSVSVNGTSVADGASYNSNSKNVTIKTTYDSTLSAAMLEYGCTSVKKFSRWYLNGEKLNIAAVTPVDNGDGTSSETYYRTLNYGDELEIETWLEVKWPDGTTDIVDEHTASVVINTPKFTTQPKGGTVGYNERHIVNWATNFTPVKQELVRYSSAGNALSTQSLDAGAFQASLFYMMDGYYYRIRSYYDYYSNAYVESDKFYVTPDQYFTPNKQHSNTEGDIITGITYVPNGDGTFNANVHVDLNYVDGQMLQYYWASTGYYWYDHNNKVNYGIGTTDTSKLVFTLYNLGKNLVPGKAWKVKVYLADDPYADYEWREVDFHYVTDTVPELKPEDVICEGDVNGDGDIKSDDALLALQKAVSKIELNEEQFGAADVNRDGEVKSDDALLILQFAVNKITEF